MCQLLLLLLLLLLNTFLCANVNCHILYYLKAGWQMDRGTGEKKDRGTEGKNIVCPYPFEAIDISTLSPKWQMALALPLDRKSKILWILNVLVEKSVNQIAVLFEYFVNLLTVNTGEFRLWSPFAIKKPAGIHFKCELLLISHSV